MATLAVRPPKISRKMLQTLVPKAAAAFYAADHPLPPLSDGGGYDCDRLLLPWDHPEFPSGVPDGAPCCDCSPPEVALYKKARTTGRPFWGCANWTPTGGGCGFRRWCEDE